MGKARYKKGNKPAVPVNHSLLFQPDRNDQGDDHKRKQRKFQCQAESEQYTKDKTVSLRMDPDLLSYPNSFLNPT